MMHGRGWQSPSTLISAAGAIGRQATSSKSATRNIGQDCLPIVQRLGRSCDEWG
jgi:hypothetical protein